MNDKPETVAIAAESAATARNNLEGYPRSLECGNVLHGPENRISGDRHHEAKAASRSTTLFGRWSLMAPITREANLTFEHVEAGKLDAVIVNGMRFLPASDVDAMRTRLATVEANAEVLIVARHDLMVAVDHLTSRIAIEDEENASEWTRLDRREAEAHEAARLLDRLAAYMKGQDDRLVAMGDQVDGLLRRAEYAERRLADMTTNRDALDEACQRKDARIAELVGEAERMDRHHDVFQQRANTMIADLTTERDNARNGWLVDLSEVERLRGDLDYLAVQLDTARTSSLHYRETLIQVRDYLAKEDRFAPTIAIINEELGRLVKPICRVVTSPRFYGEEDRQRAVKAYLFDRYTCAGDVVDTVATALGMRRA